MIIDTDISNILKNSEKRYPNWTIRNDSHILTQFNR